MDLQLKGRLALNPRTVRKGRKGPRGLMRR